MTARSLPRLYLLTDRHQTAQRPLLSVVTTALEGGARLIQLREKDLSTRELYQLAHNLIPLFTLHQAHWLINDRIDLVLALNAPGVHLRTSSLPTGIARQLLGPDRLIGVSTHSQEEVLRAEGEGADFVVLGPVFDTPSKRMYGRPLGLQVLENTCRATRLPVYAIGGITPEHVPELQSLGAYGVAVISSILQAPNIQDATKKFLDLLT
ncbi:MAG: thiamine phosphate synthase [Nitrospira sp.]|nr:thiamine phosphate synthase [Nitrospira sp.]MCA9474448.1 thiamine phosphate synthase [Nitrospira sp.]